MKYQTEKTIEAISPAGDGIIKIGPDPCYIPFTTTGDVIDAEVVQKGKTLRGKKTKLHQSGPSRTEATCPYFEQCGGCTWQHIKYPDQIEEKRQKLSQALGTETVEFLPSPNQLHYRRIARLHYQPENNGAGKLGFIQNRSNEVLNIEHCPVLSPALAKALTHLHETIVGRFPKPLEIRLAEGDQGVLIHFDSSEPLPALSYEAGRQSHKKPIIGVIFRVEGIETTLAGVNTVSQTLPGGSIVELPAGSFGQANAGTNSLLIQKVASWIEERKPQRLLELFAGAGNLTLPLSSHAARIDSVELDERACRSAKQNLKTAQRQNAHVHSGDALTVYQSLGQKADVIVLDPPRTGNFDLARAMARGDHRAIVYVSCNPRTLGRDLAELRRWGYKISNAVGFDMFPQTAHVEAAVLLERD